MSEGCKLTMKTFLTYISEGGKTKKPRRYKGTPVVVDSHGSHAQEKAPRYKGTPVVVDSHGSHAQGETPKKKRVDEKLAEPIKDKHESLWEWKHADENGHIGDLHKVDEKLTEKYRSEHHSPDHKKAIKKYTENSQRLNRHLLDHHKAGTEPGDTFENHHMGHLDDVVHERTLNHDLHVYSGVGFHPGEESAKDPEGKLHLPAYSSTSINKTTALNFATERFDSAGKRHNHILHIHLKPGQKGHYIGERGSHGNEHEFLLPRNTTLKVHPKPESFPAGSHHLNDYPVHIWHAHVVPTEEADPRQIRLNFGKPKS